jgi:hypothetical protein
VRPESRSPEQNSHTTESSGCGPEEPSNTHVIAVAAFDATSAADQLFDHLFDRVELVGHDPSSLRTLQEIGEMIR